MPTRQRRIVPLRPPAATAPPDGDGVEVASAARACLQATFANFYNALFDAACVANDEECHARTIALVRAVKVQQGAIIDAVCAELAHGRAPAAAPPARLIERALATHCVELMLEPRERALLEAALAEQLGAPDAPTPTRERAAAGATESTDRLVARLRAAGLQLDPEPVPGGAAADAGPVVASASPSAAAQEPARRAPRRAFTLALAVVVLLALAAIVLGRGGVTFRAPAAEVTRIAPRPAAQAAPVALADTLPEVAPSPPVIEAGVGAAEPVPETPPATGSPAAAAEAAPAPPPVTEATAPVAAPAREAPPFADARLAAQVDYLLRRGDAALGALRLSEPFADSAAANYAAVLAIDAGNAAARQGQERIVEAYAGLARAALVRGDTRYAQQLLARARAVLPGSAALAQLEQEITDAATHQARAPQP